MPEALLPNQRSAFTVPPEIAYFNTASLAPLLRSVQSAGAAAMERRGRPWTIAASDWFTDVERLRSLFASIVGTSSDGIALVPATSYGFAVAARNLPLRRGEQVLVLAGEYPSGIYSWRTAARRADAEVLTVQPEPDQSWTDAVLAGLSERVAIASVPHVYWTDGARLDLAAIARRCHEVGSRLVVDGSQSVGAMPLEVETLRPDFMVTVGYKWVLGPFSVSYLYVAEEHRAGEPLEESWINRAGSDDFAALVDYQDQYLPGARRYDSGQRTKFELIPMAIAALEQVVQWQVERIAATLDARNAEIARRVASLGLEVTTPQPGETHMLGVSLPADVRERAAAALAEANCFVALRGTSLRISPHLHTTDEDVDRLLAGLAQAAQH